VSKPPVPHADPYADALTSTLYDVVKVESGSYEGKMIIGVEWVMKNYRLLPQAEYRVGDIHRLTLVPWEQKTKQSPKLTDVMKVGNVI